MPEAFRPSATDAGAALPCPDDLCLDSGQPYWRMADGVGTMMVATRGTNGVVRRFTPDEHNVRSTVHGYGGGAFCVHAGVVFYVNHADQRIYRLEPGGVPLALTAAGPWAHGDLVYDTSRTRIICVRETLHETASTDVVADLVAIDAAAAGDAVVLASGRDFYMAPRVSACGAMLAWISWDRPAMPWDSARLELARLDPQGLLGPAVTLDGGADASAIEPRWDSDGCLYYLSERSGWWNLWVYDRRDGCRPLHAATEEYGFPPYILGLRTYTVPGDAADGTVYACRYSDGQPRLVRLVPGAPRASGLDLYTDARCLQLHARKLWFVHAASSTAPAIVCWDPQSGKAESFTPGPSAPWAAAAPRALRLPRSGANRTPVHGNLYLPPQASGTAPLPLLVNVHGGPTGVASAAYNPAVQFWTARGYAYFDLNHRGSTGFGRRYREQLNGHWGVAEVEDAVEAVRALVGSGVADSARIAIRGHSAGGYTVLRAVSEAACFGAAACYYGVADLAHLRATTHKFESRYLDQLLGPYPAQAERFRQRSPLFHVGAIEAPVLFLHGALDRIVPPDQSRAMAEAMRRAGKVAPHIEFSDEGHGFRQPANIAACLDIEHYFYCRAFGHAHDAAPQPLFRAELDQAFDAALRPHHLLHA